MKILLASDLSARSDRAIDRAFLLARELSAEVRVVHVVDENLPPELASQHANWAKDELEREVASVERPAGTGCAVRVVQGVPRDRILAEACEWDADLIVLGIHGPAAPRADFASTTAGRILQASAFPVLAVSRPAHAPYRRVVVGVDFSPCSRAAVRRSAWIAPGADRYLVHGFQVPFSGFLQGPTVNRLWSDYALGRMEEFVAEEMERLAAETRGAREGAAPGKRIVRKAEPGVVLTEECRRLDADLMVIGTHGRAGLSLALLGSVAADLLADPPCDLLVMKAFSF